MEVAPGLDTDTFLMAMTRFEAMRWTPSYYSDNGTKFTGAEAELWHCLSRLDHTKIGEGLATREVT